jgi:hypothetical protein
VKRKIAWILTTATFGIVLMEIAGWYSRQHKPIAAWALASFITGLVAVFASMIYLIFVVISSAPEENPLDRRYWRKWMLLLGSVEWTSWIFEGIQDAKIAGLWWPIALAATPILLIGIAFALKFARQRRRLGVV